MLSKPSHGWTEITVGNFTGYGSYIQDIPVLLMEALSRVLAYGITSSIDIDEEGTIFSITFAPDSVTLSRESESAFFPLSARHLAGELLADLRRDWDDWLTWPAECNPNLLSPCEIQEFRKDRATLLTRLINTVEKLL